MIYLYFSSSLLDWTLSEDSSYEEKRGVLSRIQRVNDHLDILGKHCHSPELLPDHRIVVLLDADWAKDELMCRCSSLLSRNSGLFRDECTRFFQLFGKGVNHVIDVSYFFDKTVSPPDTTSVEGLPGADSRGVHFFKVLREVLRDCSDVAGAEDCIFVVTDHSEAGTISLIDEDERRGEITCGPNPLWIGDIHGNERQQRQTLVIPTEDDANWKQGTVTPREYMQWLSQADFVTSLPPSRGSGSHRLFEIEFTYLPWVRDEWRAIGDGGINSSGLVETSEKRRLDDVCSIRTVQVTVAPSGDELLAGFANEKAREIGLSPRRTWWLLHGKKEGDCSPTLQNLLRNKHLPAECVAD